MSSIYSISDWSLSSSYVKDDIVKKNGKFYYACKDITSNSPFSLDNFNGYFQINAVRPYFAWNPSFGAQITTNTRLNVYQLNEGAEQRTEDGINFDSLEINLSFLGRNEAEARAIVHFLNQRKGVESFYFTPPFPYNKMKIFICPEFQHSSTFLNIHNVEARFIEKFN